MKIQCEQCGKSYKVGDQLAGRRVKCKACSALIVVPAAVGGEEEEAYGTPIPLAGEDAHGVGGDAVALAEPAAAAPARVARGTSFIGAEIEPYRAFYNRAGDKMRAMRQFAQNRVARYALNHLT